MVKSKRYSEIKYVKDNKTDVVKDDWTRASASKEGRTGKTVFANQRFDEQTDTSVEPTPMRELTRKEGKQLDREMP